MRAMLSPMIDATDPDLSAFAKRGGKLIMFMGWDDPVGAALDIARYYEKLAEPAGYARLYMVPGMVHCAEGPGATNFSTATRDLVPPLSDARHDIGVRCATGSRRTRRRARSWRRASRPLATEGKGTLVFQRPLCPWPEVARYQGGRRRKPRALPAGGSARLKVGRPN